MENFFTRYRNETVLFGILFIQVIALATQVRVSESGRAVAPQLESSSSSPRLIRVWAVALISPFQKASVNSGAAIRGLWSNYFDLLHVRQQNRQLQEQLNNLRLEQTRLQQDAEQARRLQALLGFKEQFIDKTVAAQVIGTSGTDLSRVIYIDRGSRDGVEAGMAVITPDGIVGKISRADRSTSQVLLITDPLSGAGVLLERLRLNGILKGSQAGIPEVLNVMADEKLEIGDKIVTTGGDRVYPKGLPVGTVASVAPDRERDPFLSVRVKPAVNLGKLEEVLVVTQLSEHDAAVDPTAGPIRAADMLAQRLPSAKKKSDQPDATKSPAEASTAQAANQSPTVKKPTTKVLQDSAEVSSSQSAASKPVVKKSSPEGPNSPATSKSTKPKATEAEKESPR